MITVNTKQGYFHGFLSLVFPLGLMLSPDALSLLGNRVGTDGAYFLLMLCFGAIVHAITAFSYERIHDSESRPWGEVAYVQKTLGGLTAFLFPVCTRIAFTVCAATGILATAGYVLNEVFIIWFPNLGFSFLLLTILLLIGWWSEKTVVPAQVFFMGVVVSGLMLLSLWGLSQGKTLPADNGGIGRDPFNLLYLYAMGLVFFIGFDLSVVTGVSEKRIPVRAGHRMLCTIAVGGLLLAVWGVVSLFQVAPGRLAATSVPYSIVAREILGGPGRKIMGLVIICASSGFTNALLTTMSRMLSVVVRKNRPTRNGTIPGKRSRFPLLLLSLSIMIMLASGMAGEPHLAVFTRAGIYLWLLNYVIIHLAVLTRVVRNHNGAAIRDFATPLAGFLLTLAGVVMLICFDVDSIRVLLSMAAYLGTSLFLLLVWTAMGKPFFTLSNGG